MNKTRIAILGTIGDLHKQPIRYDLAALTQIVVNLNPDLLGVELERAEFEQDDLAHAPVEVREALIPFAQNTDIVIVPIGAASPEELRAPRQGWLLGLRRGLIRRLDALLAAIQKTANDAREINSAIVSHTCGLICDLEAWASGLEGSHAWSATNAKMLANILQYAQRDPNARILVAVQCRRKHWLEPRLRQMSEIQVVDYWEL